MLYMGILLEIVLMGTLYRRHQRVSRHGGLQRILKVPGLSISPSLIALRKTPERVPRLYLFTIFVECMEGFFHRTIPQARQFFRVRTRSNAAPFFSKWSKDVFGIWVIPSSSNLSLFDPFFLDVWVLGIVMAPIISTGLETWQ